LWSIPESSEQKIRDSRYEESKLISGVMTPEEVSRSSDLLALLIPLIDNGDGTRDSLEWQRALSSIHGMIRLGA